MIKAHDLPEARDGRCPFPPRVEFQLRRINRIASALFGLRTTIGEDPSIRVTVQPDSDYVQVEFSVVAPGLRVVAEQLVNRLGWDGEPDVRRSGLARFHTWSGMVDGFRAQVTWVERPTAADSQGREALPAGVGVGDRPADADHVRVLQVLPAGLVDNQTGGAVEFTGHDGRRYVTTQQGEHQASPVPPMHKDLQRLGYEL